MPVRTTVFLWCSVFVLFLSGSVGAAATEREFVTTSPVVEDGVLYVASSKPVSRRGHLRAVDILDTFPVTLWDAAEQVPLAGDDDEQPLEISLENNTRTLLTSFRNQLIAVDGSAAEALQPELGVATISEAEMLLHTLRGRRGTSLERPSGYGEDTQRLWSISRSDPLLVGRSPVNPATGLRDRILYAGAEDGMLHAYFVSRWDEEAGGYIVDGLQGGVELWAFLPGSFLPYLKTQPFTNGIAPLAVHLDGSPNVIEAYLDLNDDGLRRWHTLLAATGTIVQEQLSCLFVIDITDPYQPELLWERLLPGDGVGRSRGVRIAACGGDELCLYLTADAAVETEAGIHALAVSLEKGELLWQFSEPYAVTGPVAAATPAVPALMDVDGDRVADTLVFGDLVGQLWALELGTGAPYGDRPIYTVPGGFDEPIGAAVAVYDNMALFGTGGLAEASDAYQYAIYAVTISAAGGSLRWRYPLAVGEKVWRAPTLDADGNLQFATAIGYPTPPLSAEPSTSGRVVVLSNSGEELASRDTGAATVGRVTAAPGVTISVDLTGETTQHGEASRLTGPAGVQGSVKLFSWRAR